MKHAEVGRVFTRTYNSTRYPSISINATYLSISTNATSIYQYKRGTTESRGAPLVKHAEAGRALLRRQPARQQLRQAVVRKHRQRLSGGGRGLDRGRDGRVGEAQA